MRNVVVIHHCDQCQKEITDTSVAFVAFADEMQRRSADFKPIARFAFAMHPWREDVAASHQARHLCSNICAVDEADRWTLTAHATAAPAPENQPLDTAS